MGKGKNRRNGNVGRTGKGGARGNVAGGSVKKDDNKRNKKSNKGKKSKNSNKKDALARSGVARLPKKKCCESRTRCTRCPLRMLKEGTLPAGYTVHKRKLVTLEKAAAKRAAKQAERAGEVA